MYSTSTLLNATVTHSVTSPSPPAWMSMETMRAAYAHAIAHGYRFYSYGDGSLLFRAAP